MLPDKLRPSSTRGFTLLEITVALGVFGLLVAGAFGLASGSIELTREVNGFEVRELARMRFLQLCRATFRELPGTARFRLTEGDSLGGGHTQVLRLSGHPRAFPVGLASGSGEAFASIMPEITLLSTRPDRAGGLMVQLYHLTGEEATRFDEEPDLEGLKTEPLTLVRGIQQVRWRFYDAKSEEWLDVWDEDIRRPRFVELSLQLNGDKRPYRSVFWVPEGHLPSDFQPPPASPPQGNPPQGTVPPENPPAGDGGANGNTPSVQIEMPTPKVNP